MRLLFAQASDFRRERDFGQKISATIEFIAAHWRGLGQVLLYLVVPATLARHLLAAVVQRYLAVELPGPGAARPLDSASVLSRQLGLWKLIYASPAYWLNTLAGSVCFTLLMLSVYAYVGLLLQRRAPGPPVAVAEVWAGVRRGFIGTFFSLWGVVLLVGVGFGCLLVPGIYLSVALSLFFIVRQAEGTGFGQTLGRCLHLVRGKWWSTFGLIFITLLLLYIILVGEGAVAVLLSGGMSAALHASRTHSPLFTVVVTSIGSVATLLLYPPLLLALAFQYFNLVERKEGVGLRLLVDSLGQTPALQVSNAAYRPTDEGEY
ncbi:hypothetical protein [Hymenobacter ruricola]|uniref:Glycerophosphoryl diester phosphodiesterase membrane domain-containing protein n=1 Tax=Hymenobacter ruricola TaxID=2791023 RepID=A0ABS0HZD5_9BACT|nr:hypothetical protein [Hymenobacter ruricola]MBF9220075.1 hypothetical protein [Hymenobacter ruricola]